MPEPVEVKVWLDYQELQGTKEKEELPAQTDLKVRKVPRVSRVPQEIRASKERLVHKVIKEMKDPKVFSVSLDLSGKKATQGKRDQKVLQVRKVPRAWLVTRVS